MKKRVKTGPLLIVSIFALLQLIPGKSNKGAQETSNDLFREYPAPAGVRAILKRSCYDCHSNNTRYPRYAFIQPARYVLDNHITLGKAELNFNEFGTYSARKKKNKLRGIGNSLIEGSMPLRSYLIVHHNAKMSVQDAKAVLTWLSGIRAANEN